MLSPNSDGGWHGRDGCTGANFTNALSFSLPVVTPVAKPGMVASADLNADGLADIAALAEGQGDEILVMLGRGDGSFGVPARYPVPSRSSSGMDDRPFAPLLLVDLDSDGRPDLATIGMDGEVSVFLGTPGGTFGPRIASGPIPFLWQVTDLSAGDLDGDGVPELLVAGQISVELKGLGNGRFQVRAAGTDALLGPVVARYLGAVVLGDFDRDGRLDYARCDQQFPDPAVYLGKGDGSFVAVDSLPARDCYSVRAADLNRDRNLDLIFYDGRFTGDLLGKGDGGFVSRTSATVCQGSSGLYPIDTNGLALADYDGDGKVDISGVQYLETQGSYVICRGNGDGTFQKPTGVSRTPWKAIGKMLTADINGDCRPDLLRVSRTPGA